MSAAWQDAESFYWRALELHPGVCTIVPEIVQDDTSTLAQGVGVRGDEPELQDGQDDICWNWSTYGAVVYVIAVLTFDIKARASEEKVLSKYRPRQVDVLMSLVSRYAFSERSLTRPSMLRCGKYKMTVRSEAGKGQRAFQPYTSGSVSV